jgi:hypothetical protein
MALAAGLTTADATQSLASVVREHPKDDKLSYWDSLNVAGRMVLVPPLMGWGHVSVLRLLALPGSVWVRPCPSALALPHISPCAHVAAHTCLRL